MKRLLLIWILLIYGLSFALSSVKAADYTLSSYELEPYIGKSLLNNGAIHEIVEEAFKSADKEAEIKYFPAVRATAVAKQGKSVGVFPVVKDNKIEKNFILSAALPGPQLGLLTNLGNDSGEINFRGKNVGVVRGTFSDSVKDSFRGAKFNYRSSNEALLQLLDAKRVDYVLIDKFTAADLMVKKMPHLIGRLEFVPSTIRYLDFHLAVPKKVKNANAIVDAFNIGLSNMKDNGSLDKILYRHGLLSFKDVVGKKTIRIATVDNGDMITMQRISRLYEQENPHIKLDWKVLDETILRVRLLSDLAVSDGQYDVMTIGAYETPIWAKKGWLSAIDKLPNDYAKDDIIAGIKKSLSDGDNLYALPFYGESSMTYYRKDLFKKAGITMPEKPTWDNIKSFAAKLHKPKEETYGICLRGKASWGENMALLTTMVNTYGGQWFDMNWQPQITSPEWKEAVAFYIDLLQNYGPPGVENNGYSETIALFSEGRCAMWVDATVAGGTLFNPKRSKVHNKLGFAPAPIKKTAKGSHWLWTWALAVPSSSRMNEEAQKFIAWATSKKYIEAVAKDQGWISAPPGTRYSTYNNQKYSQAVPFSKFVLKAIEGANPSDATVKQSPYKGVQFVAIPEFPAIGSYVGSRINEVLARKAKLPEALDEAQRFAVDKMKGSAYIK